MILTLIYDKIRTEIVELYLTVLEAFQTILKLAYGWLQASEIDKNEFRFKL